MTKMVRLGRWSPLANCTLIARRAVTIVKQQGPASGTMVLTWAFALERVTGIEPALSAWEAVPSGPVTWPDLRRGVSASDRERPLVTGVNGPLMARQTEFRSALLAAPWSSPVLLDSCCLSGRGRCVKAREATACGLALTQRTRPRQSGSEEDGTISRGSGAVSSSSSTSPSPGSVRGPRRRLYESPSPTGDRSNVWRGQRLLIRRSIENVRSVRWNPNPHVSVLPGVRRRRHSPVSSAKSVRKP